MAERGSRRGALRVAGTAAAALLLLAPFAREASAQTCDGGVFAIVPLAPGDATVRMTRSKPVSSPGATGWALEACFVLAQHGPVPEQVSSTIAFSLEGQPNVFYDLAGAVLRPVGGMPATCQILPGGEHVLLASLAPLPPFAISEECCVFVEHPTTPSCELLPGHLDVIHVEIDTPLQPPYLVSVDLNGRERVVKSGGGGGGGGCGLTGIEFLGVPLALLALRARSGRGAGGGS
jgi:hypothetical protein